MAFLSIMRHPNTWCFSLAIVFVALTVSHSIMAHLSEEARIRNSVISGLKSTDLLAGRSDFRGNVAAPYTIVEFGDHECPPCRHMEADLHVLLAQNASSVKLDFRELPLISIHPHAEEAAIAAETARITRKFWNVHDQLFAADLNQNGAVRKVLSVNGIRRNPSVGIAQVARDQALAKRIHISSTPTFILCCPSGKVLRLATLGDLPIALEQR